jgi:hypothetical protein
MSDESKPGEWLRGDTERVFTEVQLACAGATVKVAYDAMLCALSNVLVVACDMDLEKFDELLPEVMTDLQSNARINLPEIKRQLAALQEPGGQA